MNLGISTYVFLQQRLSTGLLDALCAGGLIRTIEVFAARHHFDYADRSAVRELAGWFRAHDVQAMLHQPLYADAHWSRHVAPTINLVDVEKSRRIDAMDEVKRALEAAEQIPFTAITLHLGQRDDLWSNRSLENSLTAIEHVKAFAHPLGVKVLLENIQNEVTTPEHLLEIVRVGHFDTVGFCLDVGQAHLASPGKNAGVDSAFGLLAGRIGGLHLHDTPGPGGQREELPWPRLDSPSGGATDAGTNVAIDWRNVARHMSASPASTPAILELSHDLNETIDSARQKTSAFFSGYQRIVDAMQSA